MDPAARAHPCRVLNPRGIFFLLSLAHSLWIFVADGGTGATAARAAECPAFLKSANANAAVELRSYAQTNTRTLPHYHSAFHDYVKPLAEGSPFSAAVEALGRGDLALDAGSGWAIAMMQLAKAKPGARVVAINAQDIRPSLHAVLELPGKLDASQGWDAIQTAPVPGAPHRRSVVAVGGIETSTLGGLFHLIREWPPKFLRYPMPETVTPEEIRMECESLRAALQHVFQKTGFELRAGFAEDVLLPEFSGKASLLTDFYGAFFYSATRARLLEAYFRALKPLGKAFVFLGQPSEYGHDGVRLLDGTETTLIRFLLDRHPEIFSLQSDPFHPPIHKLILTRPHGAADLKLRLEVERIEYYAERRESGYVVPKLFFREISP